MAIITKQVNNLLGKSMEVVLLMVLSQLIKALSRPDLDVSFLFMLIVPQTGDIILRDQNTDF